MCVPCVNVPLASTLNLPREREVVHPDQSSVWRELGRKRGQGACGGNVDRGAYRVVPPVAEGGTVAGQLRALGLHVEAVRGFGQRMPVADDSNDEGRERNRRVEVWLR